MAGNWRNMDKSMDDTTPRRAIAAFLENATPHDSPDPEILHQVLEEQPSLGVSPTLPFSQGDGARKRRLPSGGDPPASVSKRAVVDETQQDSLDGSEIPSQLDSPAGRPAQRFQRRRRVSGTVFQKAIAQSTKMAAAVAATLRSTQASQIESSLDESQIPATLESPEPQTLARMRTLAAAKTKRTSAALAFTQAIEETVASQELATATPAASTTLADSAAAAVAEDTLEDSSAIPSTLESPTVVSKRPAPKAKGRPSTGSAFAQAIELGRAKTADVVQAPGDSDQEMVEDPNLYAAAAAADAELELTPASGAMLSPTLLASPAGTRSFSTDALLTDVAVSGRSLSVSRASALVAPAELEEIDIFEDVVEEQPTEPSRLSVPPLPHLHSTPEKQRASLGRRQSAVTPSKVVRDQPKSLAVPVPETAPAAQDQRKSMAAQEKPLALQLEGTELEKEASAVQDKLSVHPEELEPSIEASTVQDKSLRGPRKSMTVQDKSLVVQLDQLEPTKETSLVQDKSLRSTRKSVAAQEKSLVVQLDQLEPTKETSLVQDKSLRSTRKSVAAQEKSLVVQLEQLEPSKEPSIVQERSLRDPRKSMAAQEKSVVVEQMQQLEPAKETSIVQGKSLAVESEELALPGEAPGALEESLRDQNRSLAVLEKSVAALEKSLASSAPVPVDDKSLAPQTAPTEGERGGVAVQENSLRVLEKEIASLAAELTEDDEDDLSNIPSELDSVEVDVARFRSAPAAKKRNSTSNNFMAVLSQRQPVDAKSTLSTTNQDGDVVAHHISEEGEEVLAPEPSPVAAVETRVAAPAAVHFETVTSEEGAASSSSISTSGGRAKKSLDFGASPQQQISRIINSLAASDEGAAAPPTVDAAVPAERISSPEDEYFSPPETAVEDGAGSDTSLEEVDEEALAAAAPLQRTAAGAVDKTPSVDRLKNSTVVAGGLDLGQSLLSMSPISRVDDAKEAPPGGLQATPGPPSAAAASSSRVRRRSVPQSPMYMSVMQKAMQTPRPPAAAAEATPAPAAAFEELATPTWQDVEATPDASALPPPVEADTAPQAKPMESSGRGKSLVSTSKASTSSSKPKRSWQVGSDSAEEEEEEGAWRPSQLPPLPLHLAFEKLPPRADVQYEPLEVRLKRDAKFQAKVAMQRSKHEAAERQRQQQQQRLKDQAKAERAAKRAAGAVRRPSQQQRLHRFCSFATNKANCKFYSKLKVDKTALDTWDELLHDWAEFTLDQAETFVQDEGKDALETKEDVLKLLKRQGIVKNYWQQSGLCHELLLYDESEGLLASEWPANSSKSSKPKKAAK